MNPDLSEYSNKQLANLLKHGWPSATLFTGLQTKSKNRFILDYAIKTLYAGQHSTERSIDVVKDMVRTQNHPDFYIFPKNRIKIGDKSKPEPGTVRHLLNHVLSYAPRLGLSRFVYFEDASFINDEAESALLKSLEEPFFTTKSQGTGLGLAVVRAVAQAHSGEFILNSTPVSLYILVSLLLPSFGPY